jgi:hypothetical protein
VGKKNTGRGPGRGYPPVPSYAAHVFSYKKEGCSQRSIYDPKVHRLKAASLSIPHCMLEIVAAFEGKWNLRCNIGLRIPAHSGLLKYNDFLYKAKLFCINCGVVIGLPMVPGTRIFFAKKLLFNKAFAKNSLVL